MTAKTLITKTQAMQEINVKNKASFDRIAKLKGFTTHPAVTRGRLKKGEVIGVMYDKADVIAKHNMTMEQYTQKALKA
jgi:hypothetical protein